MLEVPAPAIALQARGVGLGDIIVGGKMGSGKRGGEGGGERNHMLLALSRVIIDHASLWRRSTVPTPNGTLFQ